MANKKSFNVAPVEIPAQSAPDLSHVPEHFGASFAKAASDAAWMAAIAQRDVNTTAIELGQAAKAGQNVDPTAIMALGKALKGCGRLAVALARAQKQAEVVRLALSISTSADKSQPETVKA